MNGLEGGIVHGPGQVAQAYAVMGARLARVRQDGSVIGDDADGHLIGRALDAEDEDHAGGASVDGGQN